MSHNRFLVNVLAVAAVLLVGVAALSLAADPYGLFGTPRVSGFNDVKPRAANLGTLYKAELIRRSPAATLILGNSRAEIGFDPASPNWPPELRPVINAAAAGTGIHYAHSMLQHALSFHRPRVVLLGVDFNDFIRPLRGAQRGVGAGRSVSPWFSRTSDGDVAPGYWIHRTMGLVQHAVSLDSLIDSVITLAVQGDADAPDLRADGLNPLREYPAIVRREGYGTVFAQKDRENAKAKADRQFVLDEGAFRVLERFIDTCAREGIALTMVVYPLHVRFNELLHGVGLWGQYENWKYQLAEIVDVRRGAGADVALWDFSGYNSITAEAVPSIGDKRSETRWYWEAGHFKRELGDRMIAAMFGGVRPTAGEKVSDGESDPPIGALLDRSNVGRHVMNIRRARTDMFRSEASVLHEANRTIRVLLEKSRAP